MNQLIIKFPFKTEYFKQDFYVSTNNFSAYKLIESWPNWPSKWLNVFGASGSGKTHLTKILEKKIENVKIFDAKDVDDAVIPIIENIECIVLLFSFPAHYLDERRGRKRKQERATIKK